MDQRSRRALRQYPGPPGEANDPTSRLNSKRRRLRANSRNPSHSPQAESSNNKQPQEHLAVGPALRILQLNAEGLSAAKRSLIEVLASQHSIDVICLQETHIGTEEAGRYSINGFDLLCYTPHTKHGRATYVRTNIAKASHLTTTNFSETITIGGFHIANVYKPPSANWDQQVLPTLPHPAIYVGDFNSHHPDWGYPAADSDGEALSDWASRNDLALIHDPKQRGTFHSARWNKDYSPDLCWVSSVKGTPHPAQILILDDFPHSQHRPSLIHIGLQLPIINSPRKMRWNFRKANWTKYSEALDRSIVAIPLQNITVDEAYNRFCGAIYKAAHTAIPRGYRPLYVPCLDGESAALLQAFETSGDPEIADHLIESLSTARRKKWEETVAELNFTHSSRKCWSLIRRLGAAQKPPTQSRPSVTPNQVSTHLLTIAKAAQDKHIRRAIMTELKTHRKQLREESNPEPFDVAELEKVLQGLKCGKAAGYDNISPEFMKHLGPRALTWLTQFYTRIIHINSIPKKWRTAKVIAIPKPGKDHKLPASYRPISLLCVPSKILERLILQRISPGVEKILCVDQAGFRKDRSTGEQVLALTTYIENGFESKLKTGTVFLDLTAAYDTVWNKGLLLKLTKALPAWATATIKTLLTNRRFRVHLGQNKSAWRTQTNGLPQGSVLAPTLFNLYTNDLPNTKSRKFIYADDICLATQAPDFDSLEQVLTEDLAKLDQYCKTWRLKPSLAKTVCSVFHLQNAKAAKELNIQLSGLKLKHAPNPTYLGVTLDRTLSFKEHLKGTAAKVKSRNNLLCKLAGSQWGAAAPTLRTSALALAYSAAEYCAPVWSRSSHTHHVDAQLNTTMRIITGTIRSTPLPWLPVLSNITPPHIRRVALTQRMLQKVKDSPHLPIHADIFNPPTVRLPSRRPIWKKTPPADFTTQSAWEREWETKDAPNKHLVLDPTQQVPGTNLPRRQWSTLNRFRTGHGPCLASLHRWGSSPSPLCACGEEQTMEHIIEACPLQRLKGGLVTLHTADQEATAWLEDFAFAK